MNHWMRTRTVRLIGVLFGLSLMLSACDAEDVLGLLNGAAAEQAAAADTAGDAAADAGSDDTASGDEGSEDSADTDDAAATEAREFQCIRDGVKHRTHKARKADDEPAPADEAPAAADAPDADADADADAGADEPKPKSEPKPVADKPAPSDNGGDTGSLTAIEQDIYERLNATRQQAGLKALTLSAEISKGARAWSCDMATSGNFRHADLRTAGVNGENIAWGQRSAAEVHDGWMNSPGHRDNRMSTRWTEYGVGVCKDSGGRLYYTERFR